MATVDRASDRPVRGEASAGAHRASPITAANTIGYRIVFSMHDISRVLDGLNVVNHIDANLDP